MVPPRDIEELRTLLEVNHIQNVHAKINLAATLLELSAVEFANGETAAGGKHLLDARTAAHAARRALGPITGNCREVFLEPDQ